MSTQTKRSELRSLAIYIFSRTVSYIATLVFAVTITYILIRLMPVDIVETIISGITSTGMVYDPETINMLRNQLREMFGLKGTPIENYLNFMRRVFTFNFGPALISFPTPAKELVFSRLPWTVGLLSFTTIVSWLVGNILGILAGFYKDKKISKVLEGIAVTLYPIPYYIMALVLVFLFAYLIPVFPLTGGGITLNISFTLEGILNIIWYSTLPALSIIIIGVLGWWFLSSETLTKQIMGEDYVEYADMRGIPSKRILTRYVARNILMPQVTALGLALGGIFSGALLTEVIFSYPGVGLLAYRALFAGDLNTLMAVVFISMIGVATATYLLDILYPLIDPRVRYR